jgi:hypothetical protein
MQTMTRWPLYWYTCFIIGVMQWCMYGSLLKAVRLRITFFPFEQGDKSIWVYHSDLLVFCTTHVHTYVIVALFLPRCNTQIFTYYLLCLNRSKAISTPDVNISTDDGVHDVISRTTVSAINNPTFCYYLYFMSSLRTWTLLGRRRRRYPSLGAFADLATPTEAKRLAVSTLRPTSCSNAKAHVEFGPL